MAWTFERGSVVPIETPVTPLFLKNKETDMEILAVLLHSVFVAAIVTPTQRGVVNLKISTAMLTEILGVVIGFAISYRAGSGYDRYWMGRTRRSNVMKNARTIGRLIWFHVSPRLSPRTQAEVESGQSHRSIGEMKKVIPEKIWPEILLKVALKHHMHGELRIKYQDLYHLVKSVHDGRFETVTRPLTHDISTNIV